MYVYHLEKKGERKKGKGKGKLRSGINTFTFYFPYQREGEREREREETPLTSSSYQSYKTLNKNPPPLHLLSLSSFPPF